MALYLHVQIDVIDPSDGSTKNLRMVSHNDSSVTSLGGVTWFPVLIGMDPLEMRFFSGDFSGDTAASTGSLRVRAEPSLNDNWANYVFDGAKLQVWAAATPTAPANATKVFDGLAGTCSRELNSYTIEMKSPAALATNAVQTAKYAGTGGAEGPSEMKGNVKPYGIGRCRNVEPVLVDSAKQIYHVSTSATSLDAVFENGVNFTFSGTSYTTYALMDAAASPPVGQYTYCLDATLGLFFRLGAMPQGLITCDFKGDLGAAAYAGSAVKLLLDRAGMPAARYLAANVTAFNTAVSNATVNRYFKDEQTVQDAISEILQGCGGYYGFDELGLLFMGLTRTGGASTNTLSHARDAMPVVKRMQQLPTSAPAWRLRMNADRVWRVQNSDEISDALKQGVIDAQADADAALAQIVNIGADGVLTRIEKQAAIADWNAINSEYADVLAKGNSFNLTTLVTAYTNARNTLSTYLTGLAPAWNDTTQDTNITRNTWVANWSGYYIARQNLINAMTVQAANYASLRVISFGSTAATTVGNTFQRPTAVADYNCAVYGPVQNRSAIMGQDYHSANACTLGLDDDNTNTAIANNKYVLQTVGVNWTFYVNGSAVQSGGGIPSTSKRVYMAYDGVSIKGYIDNLALFTYTTGVTSNLSFFPKWWAFNRADVITGLWADVGSQNDWGSINAPANLAALVGTENINNALILNNIANDNKLSIQEKLGSLLKLDADLEMRYQSLRSRAVAAGVSVSNLDGQRGNWAALLASYSPAWNDTTQDTTIYTSPFNATQDAFPGAGGWQAVNATTGVSGIYTTVTDSDAAQFGVIQSQWHSAAPAQNASCALRVQKSATHTTHWVLLRILFMNSSSAVLGYGDLYFNPYNGLFGTDFSAAYGGFAAGWEVIDLNNEWHARLTMGNSPAGTAWVQYQIYPAISNGGDASYGGYSSAVTGSIAMRGPPETAVGTGNAGDWLSCGRGMLLARLAAYGSALAYVAKQVSDLDSQTTNYIKDTATRTVFEFDYTGTATGGEFPRDILFKLMTPSGGQITSGYNWTVRIVSGKWNNIASGATLYGMGVDGSGNGYFTVSSLESDSVYEVTATNASNGSVVFKKQGTLTRHLAAPPTGGGGSGSTTDFNMTSFVSTPTLTTTPMSLTAGGSALTSPTTVTANITYTPSGTGNGSWNVTQQLYKKIGSTWTAIGSAQSGFSTKIAGDPAESVSLTTTVTGLSSAFNYDVYAWLGSGGGTSRAHSVSGSLVGTH